jgi:hypothetical protein
MHATVVTAGGLDLRTLFDTFKGAGITDAWVLGNAAGDSLMSDDSQPDLVICVLSPGEAERVDPSPTGFTNLDVMLRAGQSAGRSLPTLIIVPPPLLVPSPVAGTVVARCPLDQEEVLADHVWAFVSATRAAKQSVAAPPPAPERRIDSGSFLRRLESLPYESGPDFYLGVESLTSELLQEAGAGLRESPPNVDLAFIPSDDSAAVMLVEVKAGKLTEDRLIAAEVRLQERVENTRAQLGVLVYHDIMGRIFLARYATGAAVIRLPLKELIAQLGTRNLSDVIASAVAQRGVVTS